MRDAARLLLLILLGSAVFVAQPAAAATASAAVSANVVKPLVLTRLQDLDLGTITLIPGSWSGATVSLSRAGVRTCANPNLVCTGTARVAMYNVIGSNKGVVLINAPNVTLVNQADPTQTLTLVVDGPASVTLTNSGQPGVDFPIGGTITLSGSTATGDYQGTFNVTAEYQ
jgi:hypothetical protein